MGLGRSLDVNPFSFAEHKELGSISNVLIYCNLLSFGFEIYYLIAYKKAPLKVQ